MYLYDKVKDKINVYETSIDNKLLKEYKKKYLNDIYTARIITNEQVIEDALFKGSVQFSSVDRIDEEGNFSYISLTNNKELIDSYLNGELDKQYPVYIKGNSGCDKGYHVKLENRDYVYLMTGGVHANNRFRSDDSILIKGVLSDLQPILYGNLEVLEYLCEYNYDQEFFNTINYKKIYELDYKQMEFADRHELAYKDINLEEKLERSNLVLSLINKAHKGE